ncbi:MAG TPA: alpha-amylase family glycosyl hydrolase [Kofleriaceae bacterium]|nr:alpha-amylase family glycosyl hydrolase [Kofleriaceae bacterium]
MKRLGFAVIVTGMFVACGPSISADNDSDDDDDVVQPNVGTQIGDGSVTFRVWAKHADSVFVIGDFNGWDATRNELGAEPGGYFSGTVVGAKMGQKYKYVIHHGTDVLTKADPRAARMENSVGASIIHDPNAYTWQHAFTPPPENEQVIYEMHIGAFNPLVAGKPGTWQSAIAKLDHVASLGANMVEVLPVVEFPGDFSWGYNPAWPFAPEMIYGTPEDMKQFVDEAHARGIGVIVDVVYNHWGRDDLGMRCFDGTSCATGQNGIYFYTDTTRGNTPWGPRPDYGRGEVRQYIIDNAMMWLDEYHCDGLRWDSVSNIRGLDGNPSIADGELLLRDAQDTIHQMQPGKIQIAEDLKGLASITAPTTDANGLGFDSQWDPKFYWPVANTILAATDAARDITKVTGALTAIDGANPTRRVVFSESHDSVANGRFRLPQMIDPTTPNSLNARKLSTLAASLVLTSPGVPMILQAQEMLETGSFSDKQVVDWTKETTNAPILAMYTDLIAMRRNLGGTTAGLAGANINVFHTNTNAHVFAYHRFDAGGPGDDVIVVVNMSAKPYPAYTIGFPHDGTWKVRFNGDSHRYGADFSGTISNAVTVAATPRDNLPYSGAVGVGPYSIVVLSQ